MQGNPNPEEKKTNEAQQNFRTAVSAKWSLDGRGCFIGMSEEQFESGD
jgi:hypothetical protein